MHVMRWLLLGLCFGLAPEIRADERPNVLLDGGRLVYDCETRWYLGGVYLCND